MATTEQIAAVKRYIRQRDLNRYAVFPVAEIVTCRIDGLIRVDESTGVMTWIGE